MPAQSCSATPITPRIMDGYETDKQPERAKLPKPMEFLRILQVAPAEGEAAAIASG